MPLGCLYERGACSCQRAIQAPEQDCDLHMEKDLTRERFLGEVKMP